MDPKGESEVVLAIRANRFMVAIRPPLLGIEIEQVTEQSDVRQFLGTPEQVLSETAYTSFTLPLEMRPRDRAELTSRVGDIVKTIRNNKFLSVKTTPVVLDHRTSNPFRAE